MDLSFEGLGKLILTFRKSRYFRPFYLAVLGLVVTGLFAFTGGSQVAACLGILLIPTSVFAIPYWLGERRLKNLAINALPVFVIALFLVAALQTNAMLNQGPPTLTSGFGPATKNADLTHFTFWNGTVEPYRGASDQTYTFRVRLKEVNASGAVVPPSNITISANISRYDSFLGSTSIVLPMQADPAFTNTSNGTWYAVKKQLPAAVYGFWFWTNDSRGNFTVSGFVLEPLNSPAEAYYAFWALYSAFDLIFPISFYFIIIFMYWYTIRMRKIRERVAGKARGEKLDLKKGTAEPPETPTGKTKKAAAFTCTNCGADVTEDEEKCPKCGAAFED